MIKAWCNPYATDGACALWILISENQLMWILGDGRHGIVSRVAGYYDSAFLKELDTTWIALHEAELLKSWVLR